MKAVVVGVSGFGKHGAGILAKDPNIEELILTRRNQALAQRKADLLIQDNPNTHISGVGAVNNEDLASIAGEIQPEFVYICTPDTIHADTVNAFAPYTDNILCEKPLLPRDQSIDSLNIQREQLGLHLPIYTLLTEMQKDIKHKNLTDYVRNANTLEINWFLTPCNKPIIDNITPHAWSILGAFRSPTSIDEVTADENTFTLRGTAGKTKYTINGKYCDTPARNMTVNGHLFNFDTYEKQQALLRDGRPVFRIPNPLQTTIVASLAGQPIAGYDIAKESQDYLNEINQILNR